MKIQPKNWLEFQHYKDRSPIWIKLHRRILDDYEFHCLPLASKAIAPLLWLLASEYKEGVIHGCKDKIAFRLRMSVKDMMSAIEPLISSGFFIRYHIDSDPLADLGQDAILEKRREEEEKRQKRVSDFEIFWDTFSFKQGKGGAEKSWMAIQNYSPDLLEKILAGAKREAESRPLLLAQNKTPKWAQGWLTERRWEDEPVLCILPKAETDEPAAERYRKMGLPV